MANPKLTVEIDADVSKMEQELSKANKLLAQHERNYAGVQKAISSNTQTARNLERQLSQLNSEFKSGAVTEKQYARETDRLSQELREVNSSTSDYQRELRRLEKEMDRARNSTDSFNNSTSRVQGAAGGANQAVNKLGKNTRVNAAPAMMDFSRVIQDMPYGINGVANNIQQLTAQFGYLSAKTGGSTGAIKAMLQSLAGPAGIMFAVSVVTSLLVTYGDKLVDTRSKAEKLKDEHEALSKSIEDFTDSLREANKAQIEGANDAVAQLTKLELLKSQLDDTTKSESERLKALKELQKNYPSIFESISKEEALNSSLGDSYEELRKNLSKQSEADASLKRLIELRRELNNINAVISQKFDLDELVKVREELTAFQKGDFDKVSADFNVFDAKEQLAEIDEFFKRRNRINIDIAALKNQIEEAGGVVPLEFDTSKTEKDQKPIRVQITPVIDELEGSYFGDNFFSDGNFKGVIELNKHIRENIRLLEHGKSLVPEYSKEWRRLDEVQKLNQSRLVSYNDLLTDSADKATKELSRIGKGMDAFYEAQNKSMAKTSENTAIFANAIGESISQMAGFLTEDLAKSSNAYDKFAALIINTGAQLVSQLAQQAIKNIAIKKSESTAESINAATGTASALGPAGAFVLPALIGGALALVSSSFGKVPAFQDGGVVGGNSLYGDKILARVNSQELILNRQQQAAVWGQMNNTTSMRQGGPIEIVGETIIQGDDLRVIYQRNERNRSRQT